MKKAILLAALSLTFSFLLVGCSSQKSKDTAIEEVTLENKVDYSSNIITEAPEVTTDTSDTDDIPPAEGMVRSKLTNEWVSAEIGQLRPLAVMIPNDKSALPQYNISNADVLYECLVEGEITRLMAIYGD